MKKVLIINGPNLNMLGRRNPAIYGKDSLEDIKDYTERETRHLGLCAVWEQNNMEGAIIQLNQESPLNGFKGLIINPGAYAHTSLAIGDALESIEIPKIEVHLSNTNQRESFRQVKLTAKFCDSVVEGLGKRAYAVALFAMSLLIGPQTGK